MPEQLAIAFLNSISVGTPVTVFGRTPVATRTNRNLFFCGVPASDRRWVRGSRRRLRLPGGGKHLTQAIVSAVGG